jgi:hypothetical protein
MSWEESLLEALESGNIIQLDESENDLKIEIPIINNPIGVDFNSTKDPNTYITIQYLCNWIESIKFIKKDYRILSDQILKGISPSILKDIARKDKKQAIIDVFSELCKLLPRSVSFASPSQVIEFLKESDDGSKRRKLKTIGTQIDLKTTELIITLSSIIPILPILKKDIKDIKKYVTEMNSQQLYAYFRSKAKGSIITEESENKNNDNFILAIFTVIYELFTQ